MALLSILMLTALLAVVLAFVLKLKELKTQKEDLAFISRKYRKIVEINRKRKFFTSIISHDLSSPLATIDMWVQLLQANKEGLDDEQKKSIDTIQKASQFGHGLMRKLVELENVIPEKIIIENINYSELLKKVVTEVRPLVINNAEFELNISEPVFLLSDESMIKKMCESILITVACNVEEKSKIRVGLFTNENEVVFSVLSEPIEIGMNRVSNMVSSFKQIPDSKIAGHEPLVSSLDIASRICMELNAKFASEFNEMGESIFTVKFKND